MFADTRMNNDLMPEDKKMPEDELAGANSFTNKSWILLSKTMDFTLEAEILSTNADELAAAIQPAAMPVAYLCHDSTKATAGVFRVQGGHVQSYRWQSDEVCHD